MGHNRSGDKHRARAKRRIRDAKRLAGKETVAAKPAKTQPASK